MKKICILCSDENIISARETSRIIFNNNGEETSIHPIFADRNISRDYLSIPVSETGNLPATHWFCFLNTSNDMYDKILDKSVYSTIEISGPIEFLNKWNLKIIKS